MKRENGKITAGVLPRRRSGNRTRSIKISEQAFGRVAYIAGRDGIAYSDAVSGIVQGSIAKNISREEAEFAGICARIQRSITRGDANGAASSAAEACLYWAAAPTEEEIAIAETAAIIASNIAESRRHKRA